MTGSSLVVLTCGFNLRVSTLSPQDAEELVHRGNLEALLGGHVAC